MTNKEVQEKVLAIVFQAALPWSVTTTKGTYDVNFCKSNGTLYYHLSGCSGVNNGKITIECGNGDDYWMAKRFDAEFNPGESGNRLRRVAPKWLRLPGTWGCESETVYCSVCMDHIPCDDVVEDACDHIRWDAEKGWWAGEGYEG